MWLASNPQTSISQKHYKGLTNLMSKNILGRDAWWTWLTFRILWLSATKNVQGLNPFLIYWYLDSLIKFQKLLHINLQVKMTFWLQWYQWYSGGTTMAKNVPFIHMLSSRAKFYPIWKATTDASLWRLLQLQGALVRVTGPLRWWLRKWGLGMDMWLMLWWPMGPCPPGCPVAGGIADACPQA